MKGLLIAYSFYPDKNVGAIRPTYWSRSVKKDSSISLEVLTAKEVEEDLGFKIITVKEQRKSIWRFLIKDKGLDWLIDLKFFFKSFDASDYDFIIITGSPFLHFTIGRFVKRKNPSIKVILDYRDPFSENPLFEDGFVKKIIKKYLEKRFVKDVNLLITVNEASHKYIAPWDKKTKRAVIPNGYYEKFFDDAYLPKNFEKASLVYCGKFLWEPTLLLQTLERNKVDFYHAGSKPVFDNSFFSSENYIYKGFLNQEEIPSFLKIGEIGLVLLASGKFESTTKIYDYIGLNMKILVVTKGETEIGPVNEVLEDYPNKFWVNDDEKAILEGIEILHKMPLLYYNSSKHSRKSAYEKLIIEIKNL